MTFDDVRQEVLAARAQKLKITLVFARAVVGPLQSPCYEYDSAMHLYQCTRVCLVLACDKCLVLQFVADSGDRRSMRSRASTEPQNVWLPPNTCVANDLFGHDTLSV